MEIAPEESRKATPEVKENSREEIQWRRRGGQLPHTAEKHEPRRTL